MKKRVISIILFILFVVSLYVFQTTVVGPTVEEIAGSELFMENTEDVAHPEGIKNARTDTALLHCHRYLTENFDLNSSDILSNKDYSAWGLGGYTYVVKSHVDAQNTDGGTERKTFVCTIKYKSGEDDLDYASWEISGFNYN